MGPFIFKLIENERFFSIDKTYLLYIMYIYNIKTDIINRGETMDIIISNSSGKPIYEQITSQIKNLILSGELNAGDMLPSMRLLAKELRISVITTKRAYEELEREGFIESITGKGSFVAGKNTEFLKEEHFRIIEEYLQKAVDTANKSGVTLDELIEIIKMIYKDQ